MAPTRSTCRSKSTALFLLAAAVLSGCGTPVWLEGVIAEETFVIRDSAPAARQINADGVFLLFREDDGARLRMATLEVASRSDLRVDEEIALSSDGPLQLLVSEGELIEVQRDDGATEMSSRDSHFYDIESGSVTFTSLDDVIAGRLDVTLSLGTLSGDFFVDAPACQ